MLDKESIKKIDKLKEEIENINELILTEQQKIEEHEDKICSYAARMSSINDKITNLRYSTFKDLHYNIHGVKLEPETIIGSCVADCREDGTCEDCNDYIEGCDECDKPLKDCICNKDKKS